MSSLADVLSTISDLLWAPADYLLHRPPKPDPREWLADFLDDVATRFADEGVRRTTDPTVIMLDDSSLTGRMVDDIPSQDETQGSATGGVERIASGPGWAFTIESGSWTTVERLTQILDAELEEMGQQASESSARGYQIASRATAPNSVAK